MSENKKLCGLYCRKVIVSQYNKNGNCACVGCEGALCIRCPVYLSYQDMKQKTLCRQCLAFGTKTK